MRQWRQRYVSIFLLHTYTAQFLTLFPFETWRTFADVLGGSRWLDTESSILAVVVLAHSSGVVVGTGNWCYLTEPTGVATHAHTSIAVDAVLASGSILADV